MDIYQDLENIRTIYKGKNRKNFVSKEERLKRELESKGFNLSHGKGKNKKKKRKK